MQQKATPTPEQPAQQEDSKQTVHMAAMLFQKLDRDADGKLTRAEMQSMVDNVNAAAKAKGEPCFIGSLTAHTGPLRRKLDQPLPLISFALGETHNPASQCPQGTTVGNIGGETDKTPTTTNTSPSQPNRPTLG